MTVLQHCGKRYRGRQVGRYIIGQPVGEGRYGQCFTAQDAENGRLVVAKRYKPFIFWRNKAKNAYEAVILSQLSHASIPELLGIVNEKGFYAFILEYKPGTTVESMLKKQRHRFSDSEIYRIGLRLIGIMKYLHQHGVVHRDIRTPNVLLDNREVYLVDFGLARWADGGKYRFDADFAYLGDFLLHLLYSSFTAGKGGRRLPWHRELSLSEPKIMFLKRLLRLEQPYTAIGEVEIDFLAAFSQEALT